MANLSLLFLHVARKWVLKDWNYFILVKLYRWLSRHNLILGSSRGGELTSTTMPKNYLLKMGIVQYALGGRAIKGANSINIKRKEAAQLYTSFLKENGKTAVPDHYFKDHLFLKYPILVNDQERIMVKAEENKILLGDWFVSPIHPVKKGFEKWDLQISQFPNAEYISHHVVNLPTETKEPQRVIDFLSQNKDELI
jgi:dTDP-4-amino-4,6-dideoxygalactose transaminase